MDRTPKWLVFSRVGCAFVVLGVLNKVVGFFFFGLISNKYTTFFLILIMSFAYNAKLSN